MLLKFFDHLLEKNDHPLLAMSKSALFKTPIKDKWRRESAVISIVVVVTTKDQGQNVDLLCQLDPESVHFVDTAKMVGQVVPLRDSPQEKERAHI